MFKIVFTNIGRENWEGVIETKEGTLEDAENIALIECRQRLLSRNVMLDYVGNLVYRVKAGLRTAGYVVIFSL